MTKNLVISIGKLQTFTNKAYFRYLILPVLIFTVVISYYLVDSQKPDLKAEQYVKINNKIIYTEVVKTPHDMQVGLSKYKSLSPDRGMLFVFPQKQIPIFWMKDMNFDIDIIWILDKEIVDITRNVKKPSGNNNEMLEKYSPEKLTNYVLEVNAGYSDKNGLKIGDEVEFNI